MWISQKLVYMLILTSSSALSPLPWRRRRRLFFFSSLVCFFLVSLLRIFHLIHIWGKIPSNFRWFHVSCQLAYVTRSGNQFCALQCRGWEYFKHFYQLADCWNRFVVTQYFKCDMWWNLSFTLLISEFSRNVRIKLPSMALIRIIWIITKPALCTEK